MMTTSPAGRKAISDREGNKLKAYRDSIGVLTIGVGHTSMAGPPIVTANMTITAQESDEILSRDLALFEKAVWQAVKAPLNQNQFDACVSLALNIGGGNFTKSSLVKRLNNRDYAGAADQFLVWNKAGGKVLPGLVTRRHSERQQFLRPDTRIAAPAEPAQPVPAAGVVYPPPVEPRVIMPAPAMLGSDPSNPPRSVGTFTAPASEGLWSRLSRIFKRP